MSHRECRHCPIGAGAVYCLRTKVVYVQPDDVPTPRGRKVRGDRFDVFARKAREVNKNLRDIAVLGFALLTKSQVLPSNEHDLSSIVELFRLLDAERLKGGDVS